MDGANQYSCTCRPLYTGPHCQTDGMAVLTLLIWACDHFSKNTNKNNNVGFARQSYSNSKWETQDGMWPGVMVASVYTHHSIARLAKMHGRLCYCML